MSTIKLQSIRVPAPWRVDYNTLLEWMESPLTEDSEEIFDYCEDLLQLSKENMIVDVGWYPEFNVNGSYKIVLIINNEWDQPKREYQVKTKEEMLSKLEFLLVNADTIINIKGTDDMYQGDWFCSVIKQDISDVDCYEVWAAGNKMLKQSALFVDVERREWSHICDRCVYNPENR